MKDYADAKRNAQETAMEKGDVVLVKQKRKEKTDTRDPQQFKREGNYDNSNIS